VKDQTPFPRFGERVTAVQLAGERFSTQTGHDVSCRYGRYSCICGLYIRGWFSPFPRFGERVGERGSTALSQVLGEGKQPSGWRVRGSDGRPAFWWEGVLAAGMGRPYGRYSWICGLHIRGWFSPFPRFGERVGERGSPPSPRLWERASSRQAAG
jgi:hypothetical protein